MGDAIFMAGTVHYFSFALEPEPGAGAETSVYRLQLRLRLQPKVLAPAGSGSVTLLKAIPHLSSQKESWFRLACTSFAVGFAVNSVCQLGVVCTLLQWISVHLALSSMSLMKIRNWIGPITLLRGTLGRTSFHVDFLPFRTTRCFLPVNQFLAVWSNIFQSHVLLVFPGAFPMKPYQKPLQNLAK